jgi:ketosteroid isomerase-like protein
MNQNNLTEVVDRYFAAWNEIDAERRRALIAQTWADDASYLDPLMQGQGHAGIDAMIAAVQERFAGHQFHLTGAVDAHHDRIRFAWELAPESGVAVVAGTDFGVVAADGRLHSITGFLDHVPATGSA